MRAGGPGGHPSGHRAGEESREERLRRRIRWYLLLMGCCLTLIVLAWNVVRFFSVTAAVVMSGVAALLPPVAVIVANKGEDH